MQEFGTWASSLRELRKWLVSHGVTQVAMEATGIYWRPVWHVLCAELSFELPLANAHHVKNLPERKTDVSDALWLAQLLEPSEPVNTNIATERRQPSTRIAERGFR